MHKTSAAAVSPRIAHVYETLIERLDILVFVRDKAMLQEAMEDKKSTAVDN